MKLVKTTIFSAIITFIRTASGFVAGKIVALFTGPSGVALIGQFNNFITIVLTFANGAINTGVVKYTAEYEGDENRLKQLFSTSLKISVYCSAVFGSVLLLTAPWCAKWIFDGRVYVNPVRVLGVTIILYSLNTLLISILNGRKQISTYTVVNTVGSLVALLFTVSLVYFFKIEGALYALVLSQSIVFFVTVGMIVKSDWFSWSYFNRVFDKGMAIKLSKYSLMTLVSSITGPLSQIFLRNMVISKLGIDSAGYWQAMMRISDGYLLLITTSLLTYYLPKLSGLHSREELRHEIFFGYKIIVPVVLASCMVIYFLRYIIVRVLFTKAFLPMETLFFWQLLGDFFKITAYVLAFLMLAKSMTRIYILTEVMFSAGYVLLGYLCVDYFKLSGITIAFAANYFIYLLVMLVIFRRLIFAK
ncbi:O-antigen translocase [Dinghuibacter silviterrae]|uniref:PST family polysaccharide transporter n=1 Tax=Dinghuibacter silviterrae TaxID=1539049 RepID=A0A4R8DPP4_9BACT|nr:O-antigen translocase [Dinghuibacter silviterrae]TDX00062.1 PST family polysaccharide transporter [Dinghuibacter silviterrae]